MNWQKVAISLAGIAVVGTLAAMKLLDPMAAVTFVLGLCSPGPISMMTPPKDPDKTVQP